MRNEELFFSVEEAGVPLITHCSLLITHYSLLTANCSLKIYCCFFLFAEHFFKKPY